MCMRIKDGTLWLDIQTSRVAPRTHPTPSFTVFKSLHFILSFAAVLATLHHSFVIYSSRGLPTDRPMWSDESGLKECIKGSTYPPSPQWSWVGRIRGIGSSEIFIFFLTHWHSLPWTFVSGVRVGRGLQRPRRNGQRRLAVCCRLSHVRKLFLFVFIRVSRKKSFPFIDSSVFYRTFHGHKTMKDFVRRRRWTRWAHNSHCWDFVALSFCSILTITYPHPGSVRSHCKLHGIRSHPSAWVTSHWCHAWPRAKWSRSLSGPSATREMSCVGWESASKTLRWETCWGSVL